MAGYDGRAKSERRIRKKEENSKKVEGNLQESNERATARNKGVQTDVARASGGATRLKDCVVSRGVSQRYRTIVGEK